MQNVTDVTSLAEKPILFQKNIDYLYIDSIMELTLLMNKVCNSTRPYHPPVILVNICKRLQSAFQFDINR